MHSVVISGTGLVQPPHTITNAELVESFNRFVELDNARHADAILAILNDAIVTSTALYDYHPRSPDSMEGWFAAKAAGRFPVIGLEDADGTLLGFASYGSFRAFPAYKYTVEHSIYVHRDHRGRGLGRRLLERLIDAAGEPVERVPGSDHRVWLALPPGSEGAFVARFL